MEKEPIKIKFKTIITLIIVIAVIVVSLILVFVIKTKKSIESEESQDLILSESSEEGSSNENEVNKNQVKEEKTGNVDINDAIDNFSYAFLKFENNKKNMVYSPLSINYALKMLDDGAQEDTKNQIDKILGNRDVTKYSDIENILSFANALYVRDTYSDVVKSDYMDILNDKYNAEVKFDKFEDATNVNKWIGDKTFGQIKNMLSDESVSNIDSEMILINALAIDMEWAEKIDAEGVYSDDFYLDDGSKMKASTLHNETKSDNFSYYKNKDITVLTMDLKKYDDNQLEFMAIMPKENLSDYVENFDENALKNIDKNLSKASKNKGGIYFKIPKFSFDYELGLKNDLINLGMKDAFNGKIANFNNMFDLSKTGENLYVGDALHKANISFSENGIKAAAATVIQMMNDGSLEDDGKKIEPIEVKIDKPFMFIIRDKNTDENWFTGTVYNPTSWADDSSNYTY